MSLSASTCSAWMCGQGIVRGHWCWRSGGTLALPLRWPPQTHHTGAPKKRDHCRWALVSPIAIGREHRPSKSPLQTEWQLGAIRIGTLILVEKAKKHEARGPLQAGCVGRASRSICPAGPHVRLRSRRTCSTRHDS